MIRRTDAETAAYREGFDAGRREGREDVLEIAKKLCFGVYELAYLKNIRLALDAKEKR